MNEHELRMEAYYYGFSSTGIREVDRILSAVACAGKSFHHTSQWTDEASPWPGHEGECPIDWIQISAAACAGTIGGLRMNQAADQNVIEILRARVAELEAASEITPDFCGYVWDYDNPEDSNEDTFGEYLDNQCDQETGPVLGMERRVTIAKKLPDVLLTVTEVDEHDRPKAWSVEIIKKEVRRG